MLFIHAFLITKGRIKKQIGEGLQSLALNQNLRYDDNRSTQRQQIFHHLSNQDIKEAHMFEPMVQETSLYIDIQRITHTSRKVKIYEFLLQA